MTPNEPDVRDNARYTKTEACRVLGCCPRTLERYARYFGEVPTINKVTQRPLFYGRQLRRIWRCVT